MRLIVGTRSSPLALKQTQLVTDLIRVVRPALTIDIAEFETSGDLNQNLPIAELHASAFTDRLEEALLEGEIDVAVHSYKDLPPVQPPELVIGAVPLRADPREALVSRNGRPLRDLPPNAVIGVSSERRAATLLELRPDLVIKPIRGAVDVRVAKVHQGEYDATILAVAGLARLGMLHSIAEIFEPALFPPAPGQGALAAQCRRDDVHARSVLRAIDDRKLHASVDEERESSLAVRI
jgi:hydroxymethylbilane synthase